MKIPLGAHLNFANHYRKLNDNTFTTIRSKSKKLFVSKSYLGRSPESIFSFEVAAVRPLFINEITDVMAYVDADCGRQELIDNLAALYPGETEYQLFTLYVKERFTYPEE